MIFIFLTSTFNNNKDFIKGVKKMCFYINDKLFKMINILKSINIFIF